MSELIYDTDSYTKGFNHGYELLEKGANEVYDFVSSVKESTPYFDGVKAARKQFEKAYDKDKSKEVLDKYARRGLDFEK